MRLIALTLTAGLAGCTADDGPTFRLDPSGGFWAAPLPSAHRVVDGRVDLTGWPNPDNTDVVRDLLAVLHDASGFATTAAIILPTTRPVDPDTLPTLWQTALASSQVRLVALDGATAGEQVPVWLFADDDPGPHGPNQALTALPLQGVPLVPSTTYALVVEHGVAATGGALFSAGPALRSLRRGQPVDDLSTEWTDAVVTLEDQGMDSQDIVGLTVFRTADPVGALDRAVATAPPPELRANWQQTDSFDGFCAFRGLVDLPNFQAGLPPWEGGDGQWSDPPALSRTVATRMFVTVPRGAAPADGWPIAVMVRTGGGGDRPLIDRGVRSSPGGADTPGTGLAVQLAEAGFAGVMVDGPLVGDRNPTGGDEQFLIFDVAHPGAMRDNLRQSALELALLPQALDDLSFDAAPCGEARFDAETLALIGHSMGATIAPLVTASQDRYGALVLSGAGGSWVENIVHKQSPIPTRPLAESLLGYPEGSLDVFDPALLLLQWAGEPANPPPYAAATNRDLDVFMVQGIVDTYILPPMANATTLSFGLDVAEPVLDADHPDLVDYTDITSLLELVPGQVVALPVSGNRAGTRVVVQRAEDGVEDGHEVLFQTDTAKEQLVCFLESFAAGAAQVGCD